MPRPPSLLAEAEQFITNHKPDAILTRKEWGTWVQKHGGPKYPRPAEQDAVTVYHQELLQWRYMFNKAARSKELAQRGIITFQVKVEVRGASLKVHAMMSALAHGAAEIPQSASPIRSLMKRAREIYVNGDKHNYPQEVVNFAGYVVQRGDESLQMMQLIENNYINSCNLLAQAVLKSKAGPAASKGIKSILPPPAT